MEVSGEQDSSSLPPTAKTRLRKKTESPNFFDLRNVPDAEYNNSSYWDAMSFEDIVRCNPFLRHLTFQQIQALESSMTLETLPNGDVIANEGDSIPFGIVR